MTKYQDEPIGVSELIASRNANATRTEPERGKLSREIGSALEQREDLMR
jgi:hypothetical protein